MCVGVLHAGPSLLLGIKNEGQTSITTGRVPVSFRVAGYHSDHKGALESQTSMEYASTSPDGSRKTNMPLDGSTPDN